MSPHRKTHHKSRTGCAPCRKRRVKCDELHPVCSNCSRRDEECIWPNPHRVSSLPSVPSPSTPLLTTSQSLTILSPPPVQPIFSDLTNTILLHHYTVHTCVYGVKTRKIADLRQVLTPKLGFMFPWFLHALLAHAALDLHGLYGGKRVSGGDETDYLALAKRHAKLSFKRTKRLPGTLDPMEAWAVHIRFVLLSMQGLFSPVLSLPDWKPRILLWIPHCRRLFKDMIEEVVQLRPGVPLQNTLKAMENGVQRQLGTAGPASSAVSSLSPNSSPSPSPSPGPFPPPEAAPELHPDLSLLHLPWSDIPQAEEVTDEATSSIYLDAITKLGVAYSLSYTDGHQVSAMLAWPVMVSDAFLQFMMEKRPRALVVLAHYYVFLYMRVADTVGFRRWPENDLDRIFRVLPAGENEAGDEWRGWLARTLSGPEVSTTNTASYLFPASSEHAMPFRGDFASRHQPPRHQPMIPSQHSSPPPTAPLNMGGPSTLPIPPPIMHPQSHHLTSPPHPPEIVSSHSHFVPESHPHIESASVIMNPNLNTLPQPHVQAASFASSNTVHPYHHQYPHLELPGFDYHHPLHEHHQHEHQQPQQHQQEYYLPRGEGFGYDAGWSG